MARIFETVVIAALALILGLALVVDVEAACNAMTLQPCLAASQGKVAPDPACCTAIKNIGLSADGPQCLCTLATGPLAKANGVSADAAMAIPKKCGLPVPKGFMCNNKPVPGS
ncbi:non-specific lipid-transfer protein [Physcomitrium patens]|uniref:Bifunctional inhibitor/plant lipid transfer protein/seed storage helical domain-containing protein n=1 Tax=Physcomitrium patens TaxID=3218 RepID=A0A2K1IMP3_PHYPA|nr:non-specific lipid-transfer protein 2-like [Physcomitrium patens]PNR30547.1 hypothetical protein PHYPA_026863 [Physcomitrium patens]|eukprot:XP_024360821.1 non-specific lipid-transfer protein 2-like [Physcomitrella patens]